MDSKYSVFSLLFLSFFLFFAHASAFNITKLLGQFPEFSDFNQLLNKTHLIREINTRRTITILAVDNSAISGLMDKKDDVLKRIMSLHVVLDYYDPPKLHKLSKKSALLTTLFQSSGEAIGRLGFVNVTVSTEGHIAFGSAVRGSKQDSKFVQLVASQPYNISVLQISTPIDPESIETLVLPNKTSAVPPAHAPKAHKGHKGHKGPSKAPVEAPVEAPGPSGDEADAPADAPADSPAADAPGPSDAPSDAPVGSPPSPDTDAPVDAPAPSKSSADEGRTINSLMAVLVIGMASCIMMM